MSRAPRSSPRWGEPGDSSVRCTPRSCTRHGAGAPETRAAPPAGRARPRARGAAGGVGGRAHGRGCPCRDQRASGLGAHAARRRAGGGGRGARCADRRRRSRRRTDGDPWPGPHPRDHRGRPPRCPAAGRAPPPARPARRRSHRHRRALVHRWHAGPLPRRAQRRLAEAGARDWLPPGRSRRPAVAWLPARDAPPRSASGCARSRQSSPSASKACRQRAGSPSKPSRSAPSSSAPTRVSRNVDVERRPVLLRPRAPGLRAGGAARGRAAARHRRAVRERQVVGAAGRPAGRARARRAPRQRWVAGMRCCGRADIRYGSSRACRSAG